tara:strand:- start:2715 stop:4733 length:2019 start_codon:yes stop_codon:yes gene_type:complete
MPLKTLKIPRSLNTSAENPIKQLFTPALKNSTTYDVATGYFTSGWLRDTAEGLAEFAINGGRSRWIISPDLPEADAQSIINSTTSDHTKDNSYLTRHLITLIEALKSDTQTELCTLIAAKVLDFRVAVPRKGRGMMHAKLGVFTDSNGDRVAFNGSYNHTAAAMYNWEAISVFKSWDETESSRIDDFENDFEDLWENKDTRFKVFQPSKELAELISEKADKIRTKHLIRQREEHIISLRCYQKKAVNNWFKEKGRGTYDMCTGSGKTLTALATIKRLIDEKKALFIVIVLPLRHLLDQWADEAKMVGLKPISCYMKEEDWRLKLTERLSNLRITKSGYVLALVTNSTFLNNDSFHQLINKPEMDFLLVADEAHNLGTQNALRLLPESANFRLALSATPDRHNDPKGTKEFYKYFGERCIHYPLEEAIENGYLCKYEYHPHLCLMTYKEYEEYNELSELIRIKGKGSHDAGPKKKELDDLKNQRNDLTHGVKSKFIKLKELLKIQKKNRLLPYSLVYCGFNKGPNAEPERHIERAVKIIGDLDIKVRKFTSNESVNERKDMLELFDKGDLEVIAAIKCLDEGVNVPNTRVAYILASTSNPREYIQRRGRVLRKADGKDKAIIHDFLVAPPAGQSDPNSLLIKELERANEFARIAMNKDKCLPELKELQERYGA